MGKDTTYGPPTDINVLEEFDQWIFDKSKIKELTSVLHDGSIHNKYIKISKEINDIYLNSEYLDTKSLKQLYENYEEVRRSRRAKILEKINLKGSIGLSASLVSAKVFNWLNLSLGKLSLNISLNDFIESVFFPSKGERSLYRVSQLIKK